MGIELTNDCLGKSFRTEAGKRAKITKLDISGHHYAFGGTVNGRGLKSSEHGVYWWDAKGNCNQRGHDIVAAMPATKGRVRVGGVSPATARRRQLAAPVDHEVDQLQQAYNALKVLDERAQKRCIDWLTAKLDVR